MSRERELLKRTLKYIVPKDDESLDYDLLLYSQIRDLLAEPEQEPEAWMLIDKETGARIPKAYKPEKVSEDRWELYPLYASSPKPNLIDLNQVDDHLKICDLSEDYRDGYSDGIIYAEIEHKIRGKYE